MGPGAPSGPGTPRRALARGVDERLHRPARDASSPHRASSSRCRISRAIPGCRRWPSRRWPTREPRPGRGNLPPRARPRAREHLFGPGDGGNAATGRHRGLEFPPAAALADIPERLRAMGAALGRETAPRTRRGFRGARWSARGERGRAALYGPGGYYRGGGRSRETSCARRDLFHRLRRRGPRLRGLSASRTHGARQPRPHRDPMARRRPPPGPTPSSTTPPSRRRRQPGAHQPRLGLRHARRARRDRRRSWRAAMILKALTFLVLASCSSPRSSSDRRVSRGPRPAGARRHGGDGPLPIVMREIRLPRALLGLGVGASLGPHGGSDAGLPAQPPRRAGPHRRVGVCRPRRGPCDPDRARRRLRPRAAARRPRRGRRGGRPSLPAGRQRRRHPDADPRRHRRLRLRRRHHLARAEPLAEPLRCVRNRLLASRLARRPLDDPCLDRGTLHGRGVGAHRADRARARGAHPRRGRRPHPRHRHSPPASSRGLRNRRFRGGSDRGGRGDRLRRSRRAAPLCAASSAPRRRGFCRPPPSAVPR